MAHKTLVNGIGYDVAGGKTLVDGKVYDIHKGRTLVNGIGYDISFSAIVNITGVEINSTLNYTVYADGVQFTKNGTYEVDAYEPITFRIQKLTAGTTYISVWLNGAKVASTDDFDLIDGHYVYNYEPTTSIINIKIIPGGTTALDIEITTEDD